MAASALCRRCPTPSREIVLIREWRFIGGGANFTVVLGGVPVYGIAVDEQVGLRVAPGDHVVTVSRRGPFSTPPLLPFVPSTERYYYPLETSAWSNDITLMPVAASDGEVLVGKTRRVK